ncbi:MAG: TrmH family RNA methyltransferase [Trueperaceae bacterium]
MPDGPNAPHVTSPKNPMVMALSRLKERRARSKTQTYLVEGTRETTRALTAGVPVEGLLLCPELVTNAEGAIAVRAMAEAAGASVTTLSAAAFARLSMREKPDGVLLHARFSRRKPCDVPLEPNALVLVIDGLQKPGNVGALLRTADAVGVDAVFLTGGGTDLENPNVIRASMGSVFAVTVAAGTTERVAAHVRAAGLAVVATTPAARRAHWDLDLTGGVAFVIGEEHAGLSDAWLDLADTRVRIPMRSELADSLNASVAGAVVLYEALRQRTLARANP